MEANTNTKRTQAGESAAGLELLTRAIKQGTKRPSGT
jgi:hypothetical protein